MKAFTDEEIQQWLEEGILPQEEKLSAEDEQNLQAYSQLFTSLATAPSQGLPADFAREVSTSIQLQQAKTNDRKLFIGIAAILLVMLALVIMYACSNPHFSPQWINLLLKLKWPLLFGLVVLGCIQVLDKKLLKSVY